MVVFSGTNLPPILRVGGSVDVIVSIPEDTTGIQLPPRYLLSKYIKSTTAVGRVVLPMSVISEADQKRRTKTKRRQNQRAFSTSAKRNS